MEGRKEVRHASGGRADSSAVDRVAAPSDSESMTCKVLESVCKLASVISCASVDALVVGPESHLIEWGGLHVLDLAHGRGVGVGNGVSKAYTVFRCSHQAQGTSHVGPMVKEGGSGPLHGRRGHSHPRNWVSSGLHNESDSPVVPER